LSNRQSVRFLKIAVAASLPITRHYDILVIAKPVTS